MYKVLEPNLFKYDKKSKKIIFDKNIKNLDYLDSDEKIQYFIDKVIFKLQEDPKDPKDPKDLNNGTIGLVSKFGSGKTFFMQQIFHQLFEYFTSTHPNYQVYPIYIDISKYENNFDRLLLLIFAEITKSVQALSNMTKNNSQKKVKNFLEKIKKLLPIVAKTAGSLYIKKLTNTEELISLAENVSEALGEYLIETLDEEEYYKDKLKLLSENSPMVIMIDNLDRCRPEFVLDFFVLIKRMFSVDNILFVVSYDKQQIINLLKTLYSDNVDISSYLRKYIAFEFYLPQDYDIGNFTNKYSTALNYKGYNYPNEVETVDFVLTLWTKLYENTHLSLRQHQQGISLLLKIYEKILDKKYDLLDNHKEENKMLVLLIYLKITYPYEYQNLYYFTLWNIEKLVPSEIEIILNPLQKNMFDIDIKNVLDNINFEITEYEEDREETQNQLEMSTYSTTTKQPTGKISDIIDINTIESMKHLFQVIELQKDKKNETYNLNKDTRSDPKGT